ncbi:MAG: UDP-N-acetylmuramoyl-L-alanine--D-glutamate ligase [Holosporales bacterium]|nr:UDP-N-acetylmuramoyl-L-alanine--D-glutamate ligase [Holosporales bacterium]
MTTKLEREGGAILILGYGKTGQAAADFFNRRRAESLQEGEFAGLSENGVVPEVIIFDDNLCPTEADLNKVSFIVQSPGFPPNHPILQKARQLGIEVYSDLDVFVRAVKGSQIVGITGTNGKTTSTALTHHILSSHLPAVFMGGNIGVPALALPIHSNAIYVLEISSYQLEISHPLNLSVAALTNITTDHLARHETMEEYARVKGKIFDGADYCVVCGDDPFSLGICDQLEGTGDVTEIFLENNPVLKEQLRKMTSLPGDHNLQNVAVSVNIARYFRLSEGEIAASVRGFAGVEHRLEFVAEVEGVTFINDSKATNAEALIKALASFTNNPPSPRKNCGQETHQLPHELAGTGKIFLIAGGRDKSDGIAPAVPHMQNVEAIFLIGEAQERFESEVAPWREGKAHSSGRRAVCELCPDLKDAVERAFEAARGYTRPIVLLSPACASFDQFNNFEERGKAFKDAVSAIAEASH